MALPNFLNGSSSVSLLSWHCFCSHSVTCCTKNYVVWTEIIFHIEFMLHTEIMWVKKMCFGNIKNYVTPKREVHVDEICLMFHRKGIHFDKKIVPVVYKYILYWLKKFCVARKYFDVVQKLKMVWKTSFAVFFRLRDMEC